jgi:hypothetical protein
MNSASLGHSAHHQTELQNFAWSQFQLFITGGERHDGTYDGGWGPWSEWITRSDLKPHQLTSANATLLNQNDFKQLIFSGMTSTVHENSATDRNTTPTKCNSAVPAPCSTVLYNSKAQSHISSAHLLDPKVVALFPEGANGGIDRFPDDSIIVKTAWKVVEPITSHPGLGNLVFSDPDFPGVQQFYVVLDPSQPCTDIQMVAAVTGAHNALVQQVSLQCFISVEVKTKADAETITQGVSSVKPGDYVVLLGVNIVRKQIGRWIWSTVWWTPNKNLQPEYNVKPKDLQLPQWSYYRANAIDAMFDPDNPTRRLKCYNPYLEQTVVNERVSNCVVCHRLAEYPIPPKAFELGSPAEDQSIDVGGDYFATSVKTDSLWTIPDMLDEGSHHSSGPALQTPPRAAVPQQ